MGWFARRLRKSREGLEHIPYWMWVALVALMLWISLGGYLIADTDLVVGGGGIGFIIWLALYIRKKRGL